MNNELTTVQARHMTAIRGYIESNSYPPTVAELAEIMGYSSVNSSQETIVRLQSKGFISRDNRARSIKIL